MSQGALLFKFFSHTGNNNMKKVSQVGTEHGPLADNRTRDNWTTIGFLLKPLEGNCLWSQTSHVMPIRHLVM